MRLNKGIALYLPQMPQRKLHNYLRSYRRRAGLTQEEIAFLIGSEDATKVSHFESLRKVPTLEAALAYEAIFGVPVRELFGGVFEKVNQDVICQAKLLTLTLQENAADPATARKLELLRMIIVEPQILTENQ